MKTVRDSISKLYDGLATAGLKVCSQVVERVFGRRSIDDHAKWDKETRGSAQNRIAEALASGIHNPPTGDPEAPLTAVRELGDLPPLDAGSVDDADESTEVRALEASGAVRRDGRRLLVMDPQRLLSGFLALMSDKSLWLAVEIQTKSTELFDSVVAPVQSALRRATSYDNLLQIFCQAARIYGVSVRRVSAPEIYRGAPVFVARAGTRTALTNSTSSGVIDALERHGTAEILRLLRIPPSHPVVDRLNKKDAWRVVNFRDGLLNPEFDAKRPYFFDRTVTSHALRFTMESLPEDAQPMYLDMAAQNVLEATLCRGFQLFEVPRFKPWMTRFTRSAPGHVLISLRHPETKAIDQGIELNFKDPERLHNFYNTAFGFGGSVSALISSFPLALSVIMASALALENSVHFGINYHVLHKEAENEIGKYARRVRIAGSTKAEQLESARQYIDSLIIGDD